MTAENKYEWGEGVYTLLSWFKIEKVRDARVLVAGAGALGNEVVKNLALFGVGHIYVVDFDRIEMTNLTRSVLFRESDATAHSYKAEVVAARAMEINPQIQVIPVVGKLFSDVGLGIIRRCDVIIGCLDSRIARYQLNRLAMRAGKVWIDGSIENLTGVVRVFQPEVSCYECTLSREEFNQIMLRTGCADVFRMQGSAGRIATTPISASITGAIQVQEAMKVIHKDDAGTMRPLVGKLLRYEGMTATTQIFKFQSWKHSCPAHERWMPVVAGPALSARDTVKTVLSLLRKLLGVKNVEINMRNNRFVVRVISDYPEKEFQVRIPESQLDDYIAKNAELRTLGYKTLLHKDFIENIDRHFPYPDMTLLEVGFPLMDILQVSTEKGVFYVELRGDASEMGIVTE